MNGAVEGASDLQGDIGGTDGELYGGERESWLPAHDGNGGGGGGYFQLGTFYGPTFATVQELVPPRIRASVVAFYILMLNFVGLGIGITGGGILIDALAEAGNPEPFTTTLLVFTALSAVAIPCFWIAGRRFFADRDRLYAADPQP